MKLKVTQTRSTIGCQKDQIATMEALGLKKIRDSRIQEDNAVIRGMIHKVNHLVSVEKIEE
ncbi:MAG TPA: 50S ribosomal protein L30 [Clostridiales bacterium]|nr:50S ribosomal protein L30 [Clostridiales bacterium]